MRQWAVLLCGLLAACAPGRDSRPAAGARVLPGIDVLLRDSLHLLRGLRTGLITNQTGRTAEGVASIDALAAAPDVQLVALFAPEHGIRGQAEAGVPIDDDVDSGTGLPIYSLYRETRAPTPEMLAGIDVLVFDIQDIGSRYYTYVWTMASALQAAGRAGTRFIVLDRPNPIGGTAVQGNVLDPGWASFVGLYPVPMRHGMTAGELARWLNTEFGLGAELTVIPAAGWRRSEWFDQTGLAWVAPSPNMPDLESATHYPGICLFEGTNLSVGRGTPAAFQQIGAPWLDPAAVLRELARYPLPGVRIDSARFTPRSPGDNKYASTELPAIRLRATDRAEYDPVRTAVVLLTVIARVHGDRLQFRDAHFDRLAGTDRLRRAILGGTQPDGIVGGWAADLQRFMATRARYLLYE